MTNAEKSFSRKTSFLYRLFLDIFILLSLCAVARNLPKYLQQTTADSINESPPTIGFFCDDNSLKYPYKEETISAKHLQQIGFQLPLAVIFIVEFLRFQKHEQSNIIEFVLQLYAPVARFLFGYAAERVLIAIASHQFPRLRPHFFDVCQPQRIAEDGHANICIALWNTNAYHEYIGNYSCATGNAAPQLPHGVFTSFYSGHASLICYGMLFMVLYFQERYVWHRTQYLQHVMQLIFVLIACCVSLTRIWDHMHHATDVVFGALLGATLAVIAVNFIDRKSNREEGEIEGMPATAPSNLNGVVSII